MLTRDISLEAGALDQRVQLQKRTPGTNVDALGQAVDPWATVATVWAHAAPLRGRDYFAAGQTQEELTVRFLLRYRADVGPGWRVQWRGKAYEVVGEPVDVNGRRERLELMCRRPGADTLGT